MPPRNIDLPKSKICVKLGIEFRFRKEDQMAAGPQYPSAEEYFRRATEEEQGAVMRRGAQVYARYETREGWAGFLAFYIFLCRNKDCKKLVKDYPHGFPPKQYLDCPECGAKHPFSESAAPESLMS